MAQSARDLNEALEPHTSHTGGPLRKNASHATPWQPGATVGARGGEITTGKVEGDPDWDTIFRHWNLDPAKWMVEADSLRVNAWEGPAAGGSVRVYHQYKATIVPRRAPADLDPVAKRLAAFNPKRKRHADGNGSFVVVFADWQIGGEGGHQAFLDRFEASLERTVTLAAEAAENGCGHLVVLFAGDMTEGVNASFANQHFEIDLDQAEQSRVARWAYLKALRILAPMFASSSVAAVAGNHGRTSTSVVTRPSDNHDLINFEAVAENLTDSGAAEEHDLEFFVPRPEESTVLLDASGTSILLSHGDQTKGSADSLRKWWKDVSFTRYGDADFAHMLITGHRHHLRIEEMAVGRFLVVAPALGGPSQWFADSGGGASSAGTLCFRTRGGVFTALEVA